MSPVTLGLLGIIFLAVGLGLPLYVLIGGVAAFLLLATGVFRDFSDLTNIIEMTRKLSDNEVLLAIPFFIISGALMSEGAIASRLIRVARTAFCWLPGGLAVSAVGACMFFAAISGSSPVTVIAIGGVMYPAMRKEGYGDRFAAGLVTSAGSLGILIPPSIPMIVYEIVDPTNFVDPPNYTIAADQTGSGLVELFLAGLGPGLLIGMILMGYSIIQGKLAKTSTTPFSLPDFLDAVRDGIWSLLLPVIILGGIYSGVFTPTQAACVSVVYAVIVEVFIHKSITFRKIPTVLVESTVLIGSLLIILALAQGFNKYLELANVAEAAVELLTEWELSPVAFLLLVNILLLIVGMFMDILSAILILVPLLSPIALELGIHPIHLAIIFIVNLEIGYLTPPLGLNLFVASTIFKKTLGEMVMSVVPFVGLMLLALGIVTYVPTVSIGPVAAFNGHDPIVPFPERKVPMRPPREIESLKFLSKIAAQEQEEGQEEAAKPAMDPNRPLSIEELTRLAQQDMQADAVKDTTYDTVEDVLHYYRMIQSGYLPLRDLATYIESEKAKAAEQEGQDEEEDPSDPAPSGDSPSGEGSAEP